MRAIFKLTFLCIGKIEEALEVIQYIAEVNRYKDPMSESDNPSYLPKDGQNIFVETKKNDALKVT